LFKEADIAIAFPQRDVHLDVIEPIPVQLFSESTQSQRKDQDEPPKPRLP
jgi:small-conductance mechanosensitive channel